MMDRPLMERSQASQRSPPVGMKNDKKQSHRLYPSLPNTERCKLNQSIREEPCAAADHQPERLLGGIQSEMCSTDGDSTMKEQIAALEKQRRELLSINKKWAEEYETMIQYYKEKVRGLKVSLKHDHQIEEKCEEELKHSASQKDFKSKTIRCSGECTPSQNGDVTPESPRAEQEAERLRVQNNTLIRRGQHQHEEIRRLNKALDKALQTPGPVESRGTQEEVWKHQAEVYKEDFLKERRDREKLKEKQLDLERKFRKVHTELRALKSKDKGTCTPLLPQPDPECTCRGIARDFGPHEKISLWAPATTPPPQATPTLRNCCNHTPRT